MRETFLKPLYEAVKVCLLLPFDSPSSFESSVFLWTFIQFHGNEWSSISESTIIYARNVPSLLESTGLYLSKKIKNLLKEETCSLHIRKSSASQKKMLKAPCLQKVQLSSVKRATFRLVEQYPYAVGVLHLSNTFSISAGRCNISLPLYFFERTFLCPDRSIRPNYFSIP